MRTRSIRIVQILRRIAYRPLPLDLSRSVQPQTAEEWVPQYRRHGVVADDLVTEKEMFSRRRDREGDTMMDLMDSGSRTNMANGSVPTGTIPGMLVSGTTLAGGTKHLLHKKRCRKR